MNKYTLSRCWNHLTSVIAVQTIILRDLDNLEQVNQLLDHNSATRYFAAHRTTKTLTKASLRSELLMSNQDQ